MAKKTLKKKAKKASKRGKASKPDEALKREALMLLRVANALMIRFGFNAEDAILAQVVLPNDPAPISWSRDERGVYTLQLGVEQAEPEPEPDPEPTAGTVEIELTDDDDADLDEFANSLRGGE